MASPQEEIQRLRDLLPASLRPLLTIEAMSSYSSPVGDRIVRIKPRPPWQPTGTMQIDFSRWISVPQPQRDLLFLREAGWFDGRNWLQPGLYQGLAISGSLATLLELTLQNPLSVVLAGGVTGLAVRQIWTNINSDTAQFDADEFALRRAQYRGYDRRSAARHLVMALENVQRVDKSDVQVVMRLQRLKAIAST